MFGPYEAFGANWKLTPGLENIVPDATEDHVCTIIVGVYISSICYENKY